MSDRFPAPPAKKRDEKPNEANALWRVPTWFPELPAHALEQLRAYHVELLKFNIKVNLISRNTEREADLEHFADCILASKVLFKEGLGKTVFDIGSGNGFPAIVLAVLDSTRQYNLVESDVRKCEFLKHAIHLLGLKNASVMNVRFETLANSGINIATSRGFASISKTLLICNKIFPVGGQFFHLKGKSWSTEIAELPSQLISVWRPRLAGEYVLPVSQFSRAIISTEKIQ